MIIKGLLFDLDGVITETANLHFQAWQSTLKNYDIDFSEEENAALKGLSRIETLEAILKLKNINKFSSQEKEYIATVKNNLYKQFLKTKISKENILPGIEQLIIDAKKQDIKLAICSSSQNAPLILEKIGLLEYFNFIVDPKSIAKGKPSPDIFIAGYKGLGLHNNEVLGFEDAMAGVQGLVDAKVKTVAITWKDKGNWGIADWVVESTKEISLDQLISKFL